jgi:hypothetical protein
LRIGIVLRVADLKRSAKDNRMRAKYIISLAVVGSLIILPAVVARLCGASIDVLAPIALVQFFAVAAFLFTIPVSLWLAVRAFLKNDW